jgi:hypothetical protein
MVEKVTHQLLKFQKNEEKNNGLLKKEEKLVPVYEI